MSKYPKWHDDDTLRPDSEYRRCNTCGLYEMRRWRRTAWAWCLVYQNWINQEWDACESHERAGIWLYLRRGMPLSGVGAYNPLPPYMAREYKMPGKEE